MIKNIFKVGVLISVVIVLGCQTSKAVEVEESRTVTSYGSYIVPQEWNKVDAWSNSRKYFYAKSESKNSETPTNISVEKGNNPYLAADHETFRYAILKQLALQVKRSGSNENIGGSGSFTKNGYPLYIFTIDDNKSVKTVQLYIIGEKKHVLIHVTEFYNDVRDADKIAREIADSFKWVE